MGPDNRRADPSQTVDAALLLERGHLLLQALTSEAHAARVDAKRAELELALANAESGDPSSLKQWLACDPSTHLAAAENSATGGNLAPPSRSAYASNVHPQSDVDCEFEQPETVVPRSPRSWAEVLPHSQQRLQAACEGLRESQSSSKSDFRAREPLKPDLHTNARSLAADRVEVANKVEPKHPIKRGAEKTNNSPKSARKTESGLPAISRAGTTNKVSQPVQDSQSRNAKSKVGANRVDQSPRQATKSAKQKVVAIAQTFDGLQTEEQVQKQRKLVLLSGASGFGASLFVHLIIVVALMIFTLKLPATTASLVFESTLDESVEESLEMTQPTEISTSEITPDSASEVVTDPAESLSELSALAATSLVATTPATNSLSNLATAAAAASAASGRPNPALANSSFFGASASGNCFCYVIDGSESMRGGPWEAAKSELVRSLSTLKANQRFYIVFFNKELSAISNPGEREPAPRPLYATPANLTHARSWIETLRIAPGAPPNKALKFAIEREPDAIYLLTDGDTKVDVAEFLRTNNRNNDFINGEQVMVPIHAIAFYSQLGEELMKRIAAENKGQFIYVPKPGKK